MHIRPLTNTDYPEAAVRDYFEVKTPSAYAVVGINSRPQIAFEVGNKDDLRNIELFEITGPDFVEKLAEFLAEEKLLSKVDVEDASQWWDILFLSKEGQDMCVGWEFGWVHVTEFYGNNTLEDLKSVFNVSVEPAPFEEELDPEEELDDSEPLEKVPFEELDRETQRALFIAAFVEEFKNGEGDMGAFFADRGFAFLPPEDDGSQFQQPLDF